MIAGATSAREDRPPSGSENPFTPLIGSLRGPDLFRAYCASCHGWDGKGAGPAAAALRPKVPDLTRLTANHGGTFPEQQVRAAINGTLPVTAHGSREMPVWGPIFHQVENDVDRGNVRIANLVSYLESIQALSLSIAPTGAELYQRHCAACHGSDLRGGGTAPYPFRVPPDLTSLARRHGGTFPAAYVENVLRNGVVMPAHGPAEMPIWGIDFRDADELNSAQISERIAALTQFIESRQKR